MVELWSLSSLILSVRVSFLFFTPRELLVLYWFWLVSFNFSRRDFIILDDLIATLPELFAADLALVEVVTAAAAAKDNYRGKNEPEYSLTFALLSLFHAIALAIVICAAHSPAVIEVIVDRARVCIIYG